MPTDQDFPPSSAPAYTLSRQIGFLLRLANQKHLEIFSRLMSEVTPTQFAILAKLHEIGTCSQNQLGRHVGLDAATTKGVVDRLRGKDFVRSAPSPTDLRRLEISLTDQGTAFISKALPIASEISRQSLSNLNPKEADRLIDLLAKL